MYLLINDYFSQILQVAKLYAVYYNFNSNHLKTIFSRYGIGIDYRQWPKEFSKRYGSTHVTSSPRYPQGNKAG